MADIAANNQGLIEEDIFGFFLGDLMPIRFLLNIRFVPIETGAVIQRISTFRHDLEYTIDIYSTAAPRYCPAIVICSRFPEASQVY